jgi:hypothetical protein
MLRVFSAEEITAVSVGSTRPRIMFRVSFSAAMRIGRVSRRLRSTQENEDSVRETGPLEVIFISEPKVPSLRN